MSNSDTNDQHTVTATAYAYDVGGHSPTMTTINGHAAPGSRPWTMEHGGGGGRATATAGNLVGGGSSFPTAMVGGSAPTSTSDHPPVVICIDGPSAAYGSTGGTPPAIVQDHATSRSRSLVLGPLGAPLATVDRHASVAPPTIGTSSSTPPHFATGIAAGDSDLIHRDSTAVSYTHLTLPTILRV